LAQQASVPIDREVAACAALLHDIGLYDPAARPRLYLRHDPPLRIACFTRWSGPMSDDAGVSTRSSYTIGFARSGLAAKKSNSFAWLIW
jgi:hypothetical protein